ncbi:DUF6596 domain-containing protein [Paractinoplanes durhamensis]|uniref:RNA polymerase sigma factor n=1 Tax=Paractinoplanes durhamensis TaxID=113563 RepID=A0ABQ3ZA18_9ACTN|nr:DUF6596 domain-containing protein [Actinoplanes durhamensis]GIE06664.1 hypothetical protein Adu01nite_80140 [Actinoplanes durhamensis]
MPDSARPDVRRTIEAVWKLESARIVGGLARLVHDVGLAEELAQDALVAALEQWPAAGVPDNPGAWLTTVARRRAVDHIRRAQTATAQTATAQTAAAGTLALEEEQDDVLRLLFVCCHPALERDARIALTLRLVAGLANAEIARAFLVDEPRVARRIAAAKQILAAEGAGFTRPGTASTAGRLSSVLEVLYLIFNEGYSATAGEDLIRADLCREALRLGRMLAELVPGEAEVHGLVALMELQASRAAARIGPTGELVLLHEQNRGRWDRLLIRRGFAALLRARETSSPPGPYVLQAAIAVCHAQAPTAEATDWHRIAKLYDALVRLLPTPVVQLNRAVAIGMAYGPEFGLTEADALQSIPALRDYYLLPAVRGDLLSRLGRPAAARREFERALLLTQNRAEQEFLHRRATEMAGQNKSPAAADAAAAVDAEAAATAETLGEAAAAFLAKGGLDPATLRSYRQTFTRLRRALGDSLLIDELTADVVATVCTTAWGSAAPRTWNRHRATIRSFGVWCGRPEIATELIRRAEKASPPGGGLPAAGLSGADLTAPWADSRHPLRERVFWLLLHESAAPVSTVLALNVEDLDLDDRRARVGGRWVTWRAATARLVPDLIAGRASGPLFLTARRPAPDAPADRCPHTGRARLSYERAEYLFKRATGHTLKQLRTAAR